MKTLVKDLVKLRILSEVNCNHRCELWEASKDEVFFKDKGQTTVKTLNNVEKSLSILAVRLNFQIPFN